MRRYLVILISVFACTLPLLSQQPKVLAPHRPIAPRLPDDPPKSGPLRSMVGGLWMIDANFKSTIYIKNSVEIAPVTVTPILYLSNGKKVTLADVTLEPSGTATVSVNDGLNANGISPWATLNGYVEIQYKWPWDPLCVTVTSVDTIHSVIFTNGLRPSQPMNPSAKALMAKGPGTQIIEGMWWKQEPQVTGFVTLSNTTAQAVNAQLQISDNTGESIGEHALTISAHGTKTVNLQELQAVTGNAGGLRVTYHGGPNDLLPNGGLEDETSGYSASVPFALSQTPPSKSSTQTYAELGLMSGAADPMMQFPAGTTFTPYSLLRNVSEQPASVTPSIYWMEGGTARSVRLQAIKLLPYQTQSLDVPVLLSVAGLQNFNGSFNLVFDVEGSVLMASGSVDQKNTYVFEVMPSSVMESASKSIGYWSTNNGDDTMVSLWNPADEPQDLVFTLFFSGGYYDLPLHLDPKATRTFNLSEIIQNQVPDENGNLIPPGAHEGSATISGSKAENQHILVAIDVGTYNVRKATCAYRCLNCNGMVSSSIAILGFAVPVTGHVQMSLSVKWNTGVQYNRTGIATWSSNNPNIATVNSSALVTGVSPGDTVVNGADLSEPWAGQTCGSPAPPCPPDQGFQGSGSGSVIAIKGVAPSPLIYGGGGGLIITGTGFDKLTGTINIKFDDPSITATGSVGTGANPSITGTYQVNCGASVGTHNIWVTSTGADGGAGASTNQFPIAVSLPVAPAPSILLGGQGISGTQSVVVGQRIALSATAGLPPCMSLSGQQWSPSSSGTIGTPVGGYTNNGQAGGGLPDATGGQVVDLANVPNNASSFTLYWVYGATSVPVTYQYTMSGGGSSVSSPVATATFNVSGPTGGTMTVSPYSQVVVNQLSACVLNGKNLPTGPWLQYGSLTGSCLNPFGTPGIVFNAPSGYSNSSGGSFSLVQLISSAVASGGYSHTYTVGLDTQYPYSDVLPEDDAPGVGPLNNYTNESYAVSANMFLMWQSSTAPSIPVPLGYQTWGFSGSATCTSSCGSASNWTATTNGTPGPVGGFTASTPSQTVVGNNTLQYGYPTWAGAAQ